MAWAVGGALAALFALTGWALCAAAGQQDDAQGRGDVCGECADRGCLGDCWATDGWLGETAGTPEDAP